MQPSVGCICIFNAGRTYGRGSNRFPLSYLTCRNSTALRAHRRQNQFSSSYFNFQTINLIHIPCTNIFIVIADPLSVLSAVVGLVAVSAKLGMLAKQLCDSAKDAPASMELIKEEIDHLNRIFVQVELLFKGTIKERPSRTRLTMPPLHSLITVLSGCALLFSKLQNKVGDVAGLVDPATQMPAKVVKCTLDRIKWALWKEEEVGVMLQDLQRYKSSLNLMLTIVQWHVHLSVVTKDEFI